MFEENKQGNSLMGILNLQELDERAMTSLENILGKERVDGIKNEIQNMISNEKEMDQKAIRDTAERFGVPGKVVELVSKYYQQL